MNPLSKFDAVGFISNILAVILGIVITFSIQSIVDRHAQKENISSALRLVAEELTDCRNDLSSCADYLEQERIAASYLDTNLSNLRSCPKDSVSQYGSFYISIMMLTLSDDALELLKTSSLFSSIDDNKLSLAIIRAYNQCDALCQLFNSHEQQKAETFKQIILEKGVDKCQNSDGSISITELMNTRNGKFLTIQLMSSSAEAMIVGISDIDSAIQMIDDYLNR